MIRFLEAGPTRGKLNKIKPGGKVLSALDLSRTSFYSNFNATSFSFAPQKNFIEHQVCLSCQTTALKNAQEVWHFGTQHFSDLTMAGTRQILFQSVTPRSQAKSSMSLEIAKIPIQNWSTTPEKLAAMAGGKHLAVFLTQNFLEKLADPRPMLLALKRILMQGKASVHLQTGTFGNATRSWTPIEFREFLLSSGFEIFNSDSKIETNCFWLRLTHESYKDYLEKLNLEPDTINATRLLVATENSQVFPSGGIGTFIGNFSELDRQSVTLLMDEQKRKFASSKRLINYEEVIPDFSPEMVLTGTTSTVVEAVKTLLFCFPNLNACDFPDYQSIGYRLVQAKKTGQLPTALTLRVMLLGAVDYIRHGLQDSGNPFYSWQEAKHSIMDAYVTENADACIAPSKYYAELLSSEYGYKLNNLEITRLPLTLDFLKMHTGEVFEKISKVVFLGKFNKLKGWPQFMQAITSLANENLLPKNLKIMALGPGAPSREEMVIMDRVSDFSHTYLSHEEYLRFIANNAVDSLFVLPSKGESYSYIAQELVLLGARFVTHSQGAMPETLGYSNVQSSSLCEPDSTALARSILFALEHDPIESYKNASLLALEAQKIQECTNSWWVKSGEQQLVENSSSASSNEVASVEVVTPYFNTNLNFMRELHQSIDSSSLIPRKWLIIDDGSSPEMAEALQAWVATLTSSFQIEILRKPNGGLSSARNAGLKHSQADFVFVIDSDDILTVNGLEDCAVALTCDKDLLCATGMIHYFANQKDLERLPSPASSGEYWSPIGIPEAKVLSLHENQFIHAGVMVRRNRILELGGWDEKDKSTWEDWAFYEKLAWAGHKFSLIPSPVYLYRDTPNSMSKTYNNFLGVRRLARNLITFSPRDASLLLSLSRMNPSSIGSYTADSTIEYVASLKFYQSLIHSKLFMKWLKTHEQVARITPKKVKLIIGKFLGL